MLNCRDFYGIFFLGNDTFLKSEVWPIMNIKLKQFISAAPHQPLNRISRFFVVTCIQDLHVMMLHICKKM